MDFHTLPRRQLQTLCKKHGIPANSTNKDMAEALTVLFKANPELHTEEDTVSSEAVDTVTTPARRTPRNTRRRDSVISSKSKDSANEDAISDLTHELGNQIKMKDLSSCADSEVDSNALTPAKIRTPKSAPRSSQRTTRAKASAPASVSKSVAARLEQAQETSESNEPTSEQKALRACLVDSKTDQPRKKKGAVTFSDVVEFKEVDPPVAEAPAPASARKSRTTRNTVKEQAPEPVSSTRTTARSSQRRTRGSAEVEKDIETPQKSGTRKANDPEQQPGSARRTPTRGKLQTNLDAHEEDTSKLSVHEVVRRTRRSSIAVNIDFSNEDQTTSVKRSSRQKSVADTQELTKLSISEEQELEAAVLKASTRRSTRTRGSKNDAVSSSSEASQEHESNETIENVKTSLIDSAEDRDEDVTVLGSEDKSDFEYVHMQCLNMVDETDSDKENALHLTAISDCNATESHSVSLEESDIPEENTKTEDLNTEVTEDAHVDTEESIGALLEQNIPTSVEVPVSASVPSENDSEQADLEQAEEKLLEENKDEQLASADTVESHVSKVDGDAGVDVGEFPADVNINKAIANETDPFINVDQTVVDLKEISEPQQTSINEADPSEIADQNQLPCDNTDTMEVLMEGETTIDVIEGADNESSAAIPVQDLEQNDVYANTHDLKEPEGHEVVEVAQDILTTEMDSETIEGDALLGCSSEVQDDSLSTLPLDEKVSVVLQTSPDVSMKVNVKIMLHSENTVSPPEEDEFALKLREIENINFNNAENVQTENSALPVIEQADIPVVAESFDNDSDLGTVDNSSESLQKEEVAASAVENAEESSVTPVEVESFKSDVSAALDNVSALMDMSGNTDASENPSHSASQVNQTKAVDLQSLSLRKLKELCKVKSKSGKTTNDNSGKITNDNFDITMKPVIKSMVSSQQTDSPTATKRSALKTLPSNIKQSSVIVNQHELAIVKSPTKTILLKDTRFNISSPTSYSSRWETSMNLHPR